MASVAADAEEFTHLYCQKTGKKTLQNIDVEFIAKMVQDEMQELKEAKDEAEQVDALLDAAYYIFQHIAMAGLDARPFWDLIHKANMTKFGEGGRMREDGKWLKPPNFVPPDDLIREELKKQRQTSD